MSEVEAAAACCLVGVLLLLRLLLGPATLCHFFDLRPEKFPLISMDVSVEVYLLPWKQIYFGGCTFTFMIFPQEVCGIGFKSIEVSGSFHGNTWTFPLSMKVEALNASINCSFHEFIP